MTEIDTAAGRTVLVTGAAGFIGSALCRRLSAVGCRVVGYDNLSRGRRELLPDGVRLIEGDIRDRSRVADAVAETRPDDVIHLAAMHFIPDCIARPRETIDVNVDGTRHLLDACRGGSMRRVIVASSAAVYEPSDLPCVEDTTPLRPLEVYGESKLAAERLAAAFQEETGVPTGILRIFNAVGRNETNPHVIPHIFESLQTSGPIRLGNMSPGRDYIDTRDVADAILAAVRGPQGLSVFNVGTGVAYSVSDIVDLLRALLGRPIAVTEDASRVRPAERMLLLADTRKMQEATGWQARMALEESLRDLVAAYGLQSATSSAMLSRHPPASRDDCRTT